MDIILPICVVYLSLEPIYLHIFLSICLFTYLTLFQTVCLPVYLLTQLSIYLSIYLSVHLPTYLGRCHEAELWAFNRHTPFSQDPTFLYVDSGYT